MAPPAPGSSAPPNHHRTNLAARRPMPRPMPQPHGDAPPAGAARAAAIHPGELAGDLQSSPVWSALATLMPWALSAVLHFGAFLVLMFFTFLVVQAGTAGDEDDPTVDDGPVAAGQGLGPFGGDTGQDGPGGVFVPGPRRTDRNPGDIGRPDTELVDKTNPKGGPKDSDLAQIGVLVPDRPGSVGGGGDGTEGGTAKLSKLFPPGGGGGGGGPITGFIGTGGNAHRIVYVVDKSGSMFDTFDYVKAELKLSISRLTDKQWFAVLLFADDFSPTDKFLLPLNKAGWVQATDDNKRQAAEWIDKRTYGSDGGRTDPRKALERAFNLAGGKPQLVYLLTDGMFTFPEPTVELLDRLNPDRKVKINTILFKDRSAEKLMQGIASRTGGQYRLVGEADVGK